VKNKQFTPTRFKGGYDEKEVDDFLDEVEAELTRLVRENTDLRARLQVAEQAERQQPAASAQGAAPAPAGFSVPPPAAAPLPPPPQAMAPPPPAALAPPAPFAPVAAASGSDGSQEAALRMLAMAQKTAEDTVADAKREADKVLGEARLHADQLERETSERHRNVVGNLDSERERLERKIEELRSFEREYRARLKSYLEGQLRDLDGRADGIQPTAPRPMPVAVGAGAPGSPASSGATVPASPPVTVTVPPAFTSPQQPQPSSASGSGSVSGSAPGLAQPPRPPSPFSPMPPPPVPGSSVSPGSSPQIGGPGGPLQPGGPSGPPRQATGGGFEVDEGPEVPPSNG
jgi:DivIVA domain-containing protein